MHTKTAKVVIGANYGDEGKGLATDVFVSLAGGSDAAVIRFNGGAQAGHTVTTPDGKRHVFSHFGAGTMAGAATFLTEYFVVHPGMFAVEKAALAKHGFVLEVFADPDAQITTPYDVMVNRWAEETRGAARHGSVGIGFGETIERGLGGFRIAMRDVGSDRYLIELLTDLRERWLPLRLAKLGIEYTEERQRLAADEVILNGYLDDIAALREGVTIAGIDVVLRRPNLVFEGAQGLLLDQDRGHIFPYLTRSNTGLKNVLAVAKDAGIERLDAVYMTRSYLTRHGAGPLRNQVETLDFADVVDLTNCHNPWQGTMRFAPLDIAVLRAAIEADLGDVDGTGIEVTPSLGITCLDQLREQGVYLIGDTRHVVARDAVAHWIHRHVSLPVTLTSFGPTRDHVLAWERRKLAAA